MDMLEETIRRVKAGAIDEFSLIVGRFQQRIFTYCRLILNNDEDAEDAVQDIFVKAYRSMDLYKENISFSAWLYKIAHNHCLNLLRKRQNHLRLLGLWKQHAAAASSENRVIPPASNPRFDFAWAALSAEERALLILHAVEGNTAVEIAEILSIHPETAKKRIYRVKKKLQRQTGKYKGEEQCQEISQSMIKI